MERVPLIRRHLQLHARTMRGRVGSVGWIPPEDLSEDEWAEVGILLARIDASTPWWVGDWWNHGIKNYGARKTMVESQAWQGPSFQTCANAASVCRAFETSRRREVLTFGHHRNHLASRSLAVEKDSTSNEASACVLSKESEKRGIGIGT